MLDKLIDYSMKNRLLVLLILLVVIGCGIWLIPTLNFDAFPDVTNVQVTVNTEAPGLAATEVEQLITYPIEAVMYALPNVEQVRSISKTGLSVITVVFKEGVNIYFARQQVFQQLQIAKASIPPGVGTPTMGPNTSGLGQVFQYILVTSDPKTYDIMALRSLNDWVVKPLLLPINGVTGILSFGGQVRQYQVQLNPSRLLAYQLSSKDVARAIANNNYNAGGWFLPRGNEQLTIRGVGWVRSGKQGLDDIANIPLKDEHGSVVRVHNVATVSYGSDIRQGAVTMMKRDVNGKPVSLGEVVTGIILKRIGANTKATIESIKQRLPIIEKALPQSVTLQPIYDQSQLVNKAIDTVVTALAQAFVLIFIVLLLFLMNVRSTLLVIISIPIAIGLALIAMKYWNVSANLMSLGGLAIAIGMLVDGSVVVMDNIFKHLNHTNPEQAVLQKISIATREVAKPVLFAVLIIVVVFLPLLTLQGVAGKMFQPLALSIVFAMVGSLIAALIFLPVLASFCFRSYIKTRSSFLLRSLEQGYAKGLKTALSWPKTIIATALILLVFALALVPLLGTEFVPELEEGTLNIRATLASSASLATSKQVAHQLEKQLMSFPEVTYVSSRIGRPELGGDPEPVSNIELLVGLKPIAQWQHAQNRKQLEQQMEKKLARVPGILLSFSQPIATRVDELLSGVKAQLAIKLFGPDLTVLANKGKALEQLVKSISGTRDVALEPISGEAQLVIKPNRQQLMRYGISVGQVMSLIADDIGGRKAGQVINGNERYDIYLRLAKKYRDSVTAIRNLVLKSANGSWVKLGDIASVTIETAPPQIRRDDVARRVVVQANIAGRDMGTVVANIKQKIQQQLALPAGYSIVFGGQFKNQQAAQLRLMVVVPIALLLIFMLLYFAFRSVVQALLIMVNVPLALIGGIVALYITGQYLSVPGSVGFIALLGIAVLNGVVMVSAINANTMRGLTLRDAVSDAAISRLRPVLMTAFTSLLGLIPLLFASGVGSEIQRPLATVVVGGLLSCTLLTLFVLPALYFVFIKARAS